jgi:hypothetical protein
MDERTRLKRHVRRMDQKDTIKMTEYDPDVPQLPGAWLEAGEGERIELVSLYHRRLKIKLPNPQLHAVIHVVVENQLALGDAVVINTLARLQGEGLSRHDALHAIGSVLAEDVYTLMQDDARATGETYRRYLGRLEGLTAQQWKTG